MAIVGFYFSNLIILVPVYHGHDLQKKKMESCDKLFSIFFFINWKQKKVAKKDTYDLPPTPRRMPRPPARR